MKPRPAFLIHAVLVLTVALTLFPFAFMVNSSFRSNAEYYHSIVAPPAALGGLIRSGVHYVENDRRPMTVTTDEGVTLNLSPAAAARFHLSQLEAGPKRAWVALRRYVLNSFLVSGLTAAAVCLLGSGTAYILARYRFLGHRFIFSFILATMVFPGVLTLVPSFLLVKQLGLLNTYWAMILPYVAGGQVFAIFIFKSFFAGLSEELFESARLDGAGHWALYWHIVLPLSKPVFSVVIIMNILGTWNNFLWPYIVSTDDRHQVIAAGLYTMAVSSTASNFNTMFAAYTLSSIPLLVIFVYATKPFIRGLTSGALKA